MDFIEALLRSIGFDTIWVMVDILSKYVHFIPLKYPFQAKDLSVVFKKEIIRLHGPARLIVSDHD